MKMTLRTYKYQGEADRILVFENHEITSPEVALKALMDMLYAAKGVWPDDLNGYEIVRKRSHQKKNG